MNKKNLKINCILVGVQKSGTSSLYNWLNQHPDIFGPSMPTMFNCEHEKPGAFQKDDKNFIVPIQQYGVKLISMGMLTPQDSAIVWRGPMAGSALKQLIGDTMWGELDYLLIDLPQAQVIFI